MVDVNEYFRNLAEKGGKGYVPSSATAFIIAAGLLIVMAFFFPLWHLTFKAINYPEGLNIAIHLTKFSGDIDTINTLNKYIGVMKIGWDTFPEIKLLPYSFATMAVFILIIGILGRYTVLKFGLFSLGFAAVAGSADLVWRLYLIGHRLDPKAPIKIDPFMPPLFGKGYLSAYQIISLPGTGFFIVAAAGTFLIIAFVLSILSYIDFNKTGQNNQD